MPNTDRIQEVRVLKKHPNEGEALAFLQRAANVVSPILERRGWKIKLLTEFYPDNKGLLGLNVNRGQTVKVRLRSPDKREEFLPFEHILGTLVHEITHIKIAPHSAAFYKLMEELYSEVERDISNGVSASGTLNYVAFSGTPHRLGCSTGAGNVEVWSKIRKPRNKSVLRNAQADAAMHRQQKSHLSRGSGQMLGSLAGSNDGVVSPRSKRAEAALQRINCNNKNKSNLNETRTEYISATPDCALLDDDDVVRIEVLSEVWCCPICTFRNTSDESDTSSTKRATQQCEACMSNRYNEDDVVFLGNNPSMKPPSVSVDSISCLKKRRINEMCSKWVCLHCTFVNNRHISSCSLPQNCSPENLKVGSDTCDMCDMA